MTKKWLLFIVLLPVLTSCSSIKEYFTRVDYTPGAVRGFIFRLVLEPGDSFDEVERPAKPDYSLSKNWAALPNKKDNADILPVADVEDGQANALVDVFYIHPTTYIYGDNWNQPLSDEDANEEVDRRNLRNQASIFNSCCRVYVPRYRQAIFYSFLSDQIDRDKAMDLAYMDVKRAFEYYLKHYNKGRPFILAAHSQGASHGVRLLEEEFEDKPIRKKLVVAYMIGQPLPMDKFTRTLKSIPLCSSPLQTGCVITWNTVGKNIDPTNIPKPVRIWYPDGYEANDGREIACVNPLTWTADDTYGERSLNLGGVTYPIDDEIRPSPDIGIVDAQCINGLLSVTVPEDSAYNWLPFGQGDYHTHDYDFFHMNIRQNVQKRIETYLRHSNN